MTLFQMPSKPNSSDFKGKIRAAMAGSRVTAHLPKVPDAGKVSVVDGARVQTMFNGVKVYAGSYYGTWMTNLIERLQGHHEPQEELCFEHALSKLTGKPVMIELGSFWAFYSSWFLKTFPDGKAILVEPNPLNLACSVANLGLNGVKASLELGYGGELGPADRIQSIGFHKLDIPVPRARISDLMEKYGLDYLDILHADIQGGELALIREIVPLLEGRKIGYLFISTHVDDDFHNQCIDALKGAGYRIVAQHTQAESFSGDGLIAACSPNLDNVDEIPLPVLTRDDWGPKTPEPFYGFINKVKRRLLPTG